MPDNQSNFHFLTLSVIVLLLLFSLTPRSVAQVNIKPRKLTFEPNPDGSYSGEFEIVNDSSKELTMSIRLADWDMTTEGDVNLSPVGTLNRSLGKWISGYPKRVKVPPDSEKKVGFSVNLPKGESIARWGAFIVRPVKEEKKAKKGLNVGIKVQYAVTLYQKPIDESRSGQITNLSLEDRGEIVVADFVFDNTSGTFLRPKGRLALKNGTGETVITKNLGEFVVLPDHRRSVSLELERPPPGNYRATLILDYGVTERVGAIRKIQLSEYSQDN